MRAFHLALLGPFEASVNGKRLTGFRTSRARALLVYLATEFAVGAAQQGREKLMELLWPGMPPDSARTNLRQNLYYLRRSVPPAPRAEGEKAIPFLLSERQTVSVNAEYPLEFDVLRFSALLAGPQGEWIKAVELFRGEFLSDFYLPDANPFEEWAAARRAAFRGQTLNALQILTASSVAEGQWSEGERYARRQLAIDPLREAAYRQLMKVLYWSGRRAEALKLYLECVRVLQAELGTAPSEATSTLADAIREGTLAGGQEMSELGTESEFELGYSGLDAAEIHDEKLRSTPVSPQTTSATHNLPAYATPLIGREPELAALNAFIMDPSVRLVTIVGPGGMGKTRLAVAAAERALAEGMFPDGHYYVDLTALQQTSRILPALADALSFPFPGVDNAASKQHLLSYLHQKNLLLVFDNFEHLLDGAALLSNILQAAPGVMILATSRERLNLGSEQVYPIDGLAFPDLEIAGDVADYAAGRLFLQSATRSQPDFEIRNDDDLTHLTRVCQIVAGMPLALELAASWVDMLTLDEVARELQQGLDILVTERRDLPERQRSVRASFDYTWHRLDKAEQDIFAQLSIFRGGFDRPAAQEVSGASLRQLSNLVNKSLIWFDTGRGRYEIHELLRQYGAEKLAGQPELETATYDRHSAYFLQMMAGFTAALKGKGKRKALSAIEADLKNVLLAWDHACRQQNIEAIGVSLEPFWRFYWDFGRRELTEFEQAATELRKGEVSGARGIVLGRLLAPLGRSYERRGDTATAKEMLEESLALLRRLGATKESLIPLLFLAEVQDSIEESDRLYREGLALARTVGDPWAIGHALVSLVGNARLIGHYEEAKQLGREALKQFGQNGDKVGMAVAYLELSLLAVDMGRYDEALTQARESISVIRGFNRAIRTMGLFPLGLARYALGQYEEAEKQFRQQLSVLRDFGREGPGLLFWLGEVAFGKREYAHAIQLYQESLAVAAAFGDLHLIALNRLSLGRVDVTQGRIIEAKKHCQSALQAAVQLKWRPLLLDCLVAVAELFAEEGESDKAVHLAILVLADSASRFMTKDRAEHLLTRIGGGLSSEEVDAARQRSHKNDLVSLATQLRQDL